MKRLRFLLREGFPERIRARAVFRVIAGALGILTAFGQNEDVVLAKAPDCRVSPSTGPALHKNGNAVEY